MKTTIIASLLASSFLVLANAASAADAAENWNKSCASCHAKDGSGNTTMGRKAGARDYRDAKVQAGFSDAKAIEVIKGGVTTKGKQTMKGFGDKLSNDDIKALVAYIRKFKQ